MLRTPSSRRRPPVKAANCPYCLGHIEPDYKEPEVFKKFITDRGKIMGRSRTGLCQKHQRRFAQAVKRARHLALLPFMGSPRQELGTRN